MSEEKLLTVREVSRILGISEKEVIDFVEEGRLPAYKIAGIYLRFKRSQVEEFKKVNPNFLKNSKEKISIKEKIYDFFYFNDFYVISIIIIIWLIVIILGVQ
ncbi:MAG: helix-turn-helix domain-containing protein [Candidatus Omnitrophica bacterium]|nr:helix-turn-helix domain-containing protein [Candidatus Omnitrophota bacterium]MCM8799310.1 helix-turn-helix domain-containing protein [Candidatus Omnitrophota bacterium]